MREQLEATFGASPMDMMKMQTPLKFIEEQTKRNMDMFNNAMRMFTPAKGGEEPKDEDTGEEDDLGELREQIAAMQKKLDKLGR